MTTETENTKPFYETDEGMQEERDRILDEYNRKHGWSSDGSNNGDNNGNNGNGKGHKGGKKQPKTSQEQKDKPEFSVFKYSRRFKGQLHEAILLKDKPVFIRLRGNEGIQVLDKIIEDNRILVPPCIEEYPYEPIEFESEEELQQYFEKARHETIETLFQRVFKTISIYVDQDEDIRIIISADIVWTFFQDLFPTTHYYDISGTGNGIGKSTIGHMFEGIAYRAVRMTDPSAANLFRVLGKIEVGQCIMILDEADRMHTDKDMISILKEGYQHGGRVPKVNMNTGKQEWFFCYCFKIRIAEEPIRHAVAKGVLDRTFSIRAIKAIIDPPHDIKEVLHPAARIAANEVLLNDLRDLKKLQLIYRIIHFEDPIIDMDSGYSGRDKELCKPLFQLFHNSESYGRIVQAVRSFLSKKNKRKNTVSIEPVLYKIVSDMLDDINPETGKKLYPNYTISVRDIWDKIITTVDGVYDPKKPNVFESYDYGTIYRSTITKIFEGFGAESRHKETGNILIFDPVRMEKIGKIFEEALKDMKAEGTEGTEVAREISTSVSDNNNNLKAEAGFLHTTSVPSVPSGSNKEVSQDRYFYNGNWYCRHCRFRGRDRFEMDNHKCTGKKEPRI